MDANRAFSRMLRRTAGLAACLVLGPAIAMAAPILSVTLTSPAKTNNCTLHPGSGDEIETGTAKECTSTAYKPVLADWSSKFIVGNFDGKAPTNQTFQTAFSNWKTDQNANFGGKWNIQNGGNLDVTFTVTDTAVAGATLGGINPFSITVTKNTGYAGPAFTQLVWTQALYTSYDPKPPFKTDLNPPANTLDTYSFSKNNPGSGGAFLAPCTPIPGQTPGANNTTPATIPASPANKAYCDPIYPFQNGNAGFFDGPQAFWPDESFRAIALLSTVTFMTDGTGAVTKELLTVYNGVSWGFDLSVPEPSSIVLMLSGLALLGLLWGRRAV